MNCQQTRELVSAYSDQELTGQQMLEIRAHLDLCPSCAREWREINDVRRLLRALSSPTPDGDAEDKLAERLRCEQETGIAGLVALSLSRLPVLWEEAPLRDRRPQGRRTTYAFALASVVMLTVAAPFAPSTGDAIGGIFLSSPTAPQGTNPTPGVAQASLTSSLRMTGAANAYEVDPLQDDTISGYIQGEATMAGFQTSDNGAH